ncbi:MAG: DUF4330 domain-containing protein [Defluviitaleaceae bacterium]|nr:DUF4330 domain-containing protein [Defluviitaleaceae bacterium]
MIDKKGRLFGKVSLVDLFAAVVLLAVFYVVFTAARAGDRLEMSDEQPVAITFFSPAALEFVADAFQMGVPVTDGERNTFLGYVADIKKDDSIFFVTDVRGNEVAAHREGYASVYVTSRTMGRMSDGAVVLGGVVYTVGTAVFMWAGDVFLVTHISNIQAEGSYDHR